MPDYAPESIAQDFLYLELMSQYTVITQEQWNKESAALSEYYHTEPRPEQRPVMTSWDYLLMDTLDGVEYWLPNDETWFDVVAVDHVNELAAFTGFCEMNDFTYEDSEYRYVMDPSDKQLKCKFQIERN